MAPRTLPGAGVPILGAVPSRGSITATAPGDAYIAGLGRALSGPGRKKADLLAETRDGLEDATEAMGADGLTRWEAEQQAVAGTTPVGRGGAWIPGRARIRPRPADCGAVVPRHAGTACHLARRILAPGTSTKTEAGRWRSS